MVFAEWVGGLRKALRLLAIGWGGGGPDGAGPAASPPPGPGPAAGGRAFGRLRGMPRKQSALTHVSSIGASMRLTALPRPALRHPPHIPRARWVGSLKAGAEANAVRTKGSHPPQQSRSRAALPKP